jgi:hypothetical protein
MIFDDLRFVRYGNHSEKCERLLFDPTVLSPKLTTMSRNFRLLETGQRLGRRADCPASPFL